MATIYQWSERHILILLLKENNKNACPYTYIQDKLPEFQ